MNRDCDVDIALKLSMKRAYVKGWMSLDTAKMLYDGDVPAVESFAASITGDILNGFKKTAAKFKDRLSSLLSGDHPRKNTTPMKIPRITPDEWNKLREDGKGLSSLLDVVVKNFIPSRLGTEAGCKTFVELVIRSLETPRHFLPSYKADVKGIHLTVKPTPPKTNLIPRTTQISGWSQETLRAIPSQVVEIQKAYDYYTLRLVGRVNSLDAESDPENDHMDKALSAVLTVLRTTRQQSDEWLRLLNDSRVLE